MNCAVFLDNGVLALYNGDTSSQYSCFVHAPGWRTSPFGGVEPMPISDTPLIDDPRNVSLQVVIPCFSRGNSGAKIQTLVGEGLRLLDP